MGIKANVGSNETEEQKRRKSFHYIMEFALMLLLYYLCECYIPCDDSRNCEMRFYQMSQIR